LSPVKTLHFCKCPHNPRRPRQACNPTLTELLSEWVV
jgi:hypothetical protein